MDLLLSRRIALEARNRFQAHLSLRTAVSEDGIQGGTATRAGGGGRLSVACDLNFHFPALRRSALDARVMS